ncbi:UNVERIFIED_CONTAM: hypothetical protein Sradi_0892500 [Sesamum radiatum]|uniref:Uncharacterized protein n=1 Tax=Sesamum radiatum TaxID=300843 RepID=A0AAW2V317_SESRA
MVVPLPLEDLPLMLTTSGVPLVRKREHPPHKKVPPRTGWRTLKNLSRTSLGSPGKAGGCPPQKNLQEVPPGKAGGHPPQKNLQDVLLEEQEGILFRK